MDSFSVWAMYVITGKISHATMDICAVNKGRLKSFHVCYWRSKKLRSYYPTNSTTAVDEKYGVTKKKWNQTPPFPQLLLLIPPVTSQTMIMQWKVWEVSAMPLMQRCSAYITALLGTQKSYPHTYVGLRYAHLVVVDMVIIFFLFRVDILKWQKIIHMKEWIKRLLFANLYLFVLEHYQYR